MSGLLYIAPTRNSIVSRLKPRAKIIRIGKRSALHLTHAKRLVMQVKMDNTTKQLM